MTMTTQAAQNAGRYVRRAGLPVTALLLLLAVFAMHGPSSGHTMLVPAGAAMHAGHHPSSGLHPAAGPAMAMHHAECVGTLRYDDPTAPPLTAVVVAATQRPVAATGPQVSPTVRGPPAPSLERLCISRT